MLNSLIRNKIHTLQLHAILITSNAAKFPYNAFISAYLRSSLPGNALHLFVEMLRRSIRPNCHTFPAVVRAAASFVHSSPGSGCSMHAQAVRRGVMLDDFTNCALVEFYGQLGDVGSARKVFDELPCPDVASCNSMINALCCNGDVVMALVLFGGMVNRDVISWTSVISGCARNSKFDEAIELFRRLVNCDDDLFVRPNEATFVSVLTACANTSRIGALRIGMEVHGHVIRFGVPLTVFLGTTLIDMYSKHGKLGFCTNVFEVMSKKEVCSWNAMIFALTDHGKSAEAILLFDKMRSVGMQPNHINFVAVLTACAREKSVELGLRLFNSMSSDFKVAPVMEHYGCIVNLLSRAGLMNETIQFIRKMPFEANASVLGALSGACMAQENIKVGARVGAQLIKLQPWHCGRYTVLRNIYAGANHWEDVVKLKAAMAQAGIKKIAGYSWIH